MMAIMVSVGALTLEIISVSGCMIILMTSGPSTKPPQRSILQDSSRSVQKSALHSYKRTKVVNSEASRTPDTGSWHIN